MRFSQNRFRELLLLAGLCGLFFFFRLSGIGLLGPDEPRYAQVAREMLAAHNWVTPTLYGHTWLEKPILLYWGEMISYLVFGVSDWAARVPSAVAATLLVAGCFLAVRRIRPTARLDAALMVATGLLVMGFARAAATDMLLAAPLCLSLLAWFCWYQATYAPQDEASGGRFPLVLFYALNAVAMLAKGPVAPGLAALVVLAFCAVERNPRAVWKTLDPLGLVVFVAVAAPWYVLVQLRTPEFFRVFFLQHNLARFGSNLYRHRQPFWYYIPVALVATLPWTVWLFHGLGDAWRGVKERLRNEPQSGQADGAEAAEPDVAPDYAFEIFLTCWALVPIVFFSLSHSKLPGYILPAIPALLILAAVAVHRRAARQASPHWIAVTIHALLLAVVAAAVCLAPRLLYHMRLSAQSLMVAALVATVVFLVVALPLLVSGWRMLRFVTLLPLILAVGFVLRVLAPSVDATQSTRPLAGLMIAIGEGEPDALPVATFGLSRNVAFGLSFYLDRTVTAYEGLEVSPAVFEFPPAVPQTAHLVVVREGSRPSLLLLIGGRNLRFRGAYRPQHMEIYEVSGVGQ